MATQLVSSLTSLCNYVTSGDISSDPYVTLPSAGLQKIWINVTVSNSGANSITGLKVELFGDADSIDAFPLLPDSVVGNGSSLTGNAVSVQDALSSTVVSIVLIEPPPIVTLKFSATTMPASFNTSFVRGTAVWR